MTEQATRSVVYEPECATEANEQVTRNVCSGHVYYFKPYLFKSHATQVTRTFQEAYRSSVFLERLTRGLQCVTGPVETVPPKVRRPMTAPALNLASKVHASLQLQDFKKKLKLLQCDDLVQLIS